MVLGQCTNDKWLACVHFGCSSVLGLNNLRLWTALLTVHFCCVFLCAQSTRPMLCQAALAAQTTGMALHSPRCCCLQGRAPTGEPPAVCSEVLSSAKCMSMATTVAECVTFLAPVAPQLNPQFAKAAYSHLFYTALFFVIVLVHRLFIRSPPPSTAAAANGSSLSPARGADDVTQTPVRYGPPPTGTELTACD